MNNELTTISTELEINSVTTIDPTINNHHPANGRSIEPNIQKTNGSRVNPSPDQAKDFAKANTTLLVWLVFLTLGGSVLALYYADIRYLPEIEWTSTLIYIAIASMIGGVVAVVLSLSLLIPGLIWNVFLVCDDTLAGFFCYKEGNRRDPSVFDISYRLGLPFGFVLLLSHFGLLKSATFYVGTALMLLGLSSIFMYVRFKSLVQKNRGATGDGTVSADSKVDSKRIMKHTFWFGLTVFLGQTAILITFVLSGRPSGSDFWILTAICSSSVFISNLVVTMLHTHHPRQAVLSSAISALLLLAVANQYSSLPKGIMSLYGFSTGTKYSFFLNEDGARLVERFELSNQGCSNGPSAPDRLCNVEILSSLGNDYYLKVGAAKITMPKSMVVARKAE